MIFRRTDKYGYSRYYGGGGPAFVIKIVVTIFLMVALVIGAAAFVMQKYMVYTENGGHLELPWEKKASQPAQNDKDPGGLEGLIVTEESGETSAPAEQSAEQSAEADKSAGQSAQAETSVPAEQSAQAETSARAETSQNTDSSAEAQPVQPAKPGWWERLVSWFKSLFQTPQTAVQPSGSSSAVPEGSQSTGKDPADGSQEIKDREQTDEGQQSTQSETKSETKSEAKPKKEPLSGGLLLQHVSIGDVKANYAEGDIKNKKGNGIMLFMKESGGKLNFVSGESLARELDVNTDGSTADKVKQVISELREKGYYTLAYLNCFQDQKAGAKSELGLYDEGNAAWYDGEDRAWADPANEEYQDYLIALAQELEDMGFDEIVLNNACYPLTGNTSILSKSCYDPGTFRKTVSAFYQKVDKKLSGGKSMISVLTTEKAILEGYDETSGQSLEDMLQLGGRLWVDADGGKAEELSKALSQAGYPDNALGVVVSSLKSEGGYNQLNPD